MATTKQATKIQPIAFPNGLNIPLPLDSSTPLEYAELLGEAYLSSANHSARKNGGHYQTPASVAKFMTECADYSQPYLRVLDPEAAQVFYRPQYARRH